MTTTHFFVKYGLGDGAALAACLLVAYMVTKVAAVSRRHRRITATGWLACWLFITVPVAAMALMRWQELHPLGTPGHVSRHSGWEAVPVALGLWIASIVIMQICWGAAGRERKKMDRWNNRQALRQKARQELDSGLWLPETDQLFT